MEHQRRIIGLIMLATFIVLVGSGFLSYFLMYDRGIATIHTMSGMLFTAAGFAHLYTNIRPLKQYSKNGALFAMLAIVVLFSYLWYLEITPAKIIMDFGARSKAQSGISTSDNSYSKVSMNMGNDNLLSLDIKRAQHFWHPQIAIWTEDTTGHYIETLFVTNATAKGIFSGGRSKENFKSLDAFSSSNNNESYRRVNALPVWSHKRNIKYEDGLYVPTYEQPLVDAISGATPLNNFILETSVDYEKPFVVKFEINVAFDDNEYYSAYDFPDDDTFHNGTGQLGQPSLVYASNIFPEKNASHQIMKLQGHGHHSAQNGLIYNETNTLTTALEIIAFIVVGYKNSNSKL